MAGVEQGRRLREQALEHLDLGDAGAAASAAAQAVRILRRSVRDAPLQADVDGPLLELVAALTTLSNCRAATGEHATGRAAAAEAVRLSRGRPGDDAWSGALARSLNSLGNRHMEMGEQERAAEVMAEAAGILSDLVGRGHAAYRADLGMVLTNLATVQAALGEIDRSMESATESVGIFQELVQSTPDTATNLAVALGNLAVISAHQGQRETAIDLLTQAVTIQRDVVINRGTDDAFAALAMYLNNLAAELQEADMLPQAVAASEEAVSIRRRLAQRQDRFRRDLGRSLHNLGVQLYELGERDRAILTMSEAVDLRRRLAAAGSAQDVHSLDRSRQTLALMREGG